VNRRRCSRRRSGQLEHGETAGVRSQGMTRQEREPALARGDGAEAPHADEKGHAIEIDSAAARFLMPGDASRGSLSLGLDSMSRLLISRQIDGGQQ
jgi:hypothetical protein